MDRVTNKEILERTELPSMEDLLINKTDYQSRFSTLNCLLVTEREAAVASGSRIPSRET